MFIHKVIHDSGWSRPLVARSFPVARKPRRRPGRRYLQGPALPAGPGSSVVCGARAPAFGYNLLN